MNFIHSWYWSKMFVLFKPFQRNEVKHRTKKKWFSRFFLKFLNWYLPKYCVHLVADALISQIHNNHLIEKSNFQGTNSTSSFREHCICSKISHIFLLEGPNVNSSSIYLRLGGDILERGFLLVSRMFKLKPLMKKSFRCWVQPLDILQYDTQVLKFKSSKKVC